MDPYPFGFSSSGLWTLDGCKLTLRVFTIGFGALLALAEWERFWVRTVGILAIEGRYATATQPARAVLEIFSSTFFGLYEPTPVG